MSESPIELSLDADMQSASIKVPPHSVEAEQSVIGGLMLDNQTFDDVSEITSDVDFYRRDHRLIFRAISQLAELGRPFDVVTLGEALDNAGILEDSGGMGYLALLAKNTPSASNIKAYAEIVRERSVLRQMISISSEIADAAFHPEGRSSTELLDEAERKVFGIAEQGSKKGGPQPIKDVLKSTVDRIDQMFKSDEKFTGIPTGFTDLDEKTSGLQAGALVVVAARPAMGKTTFSMNMAENALIRTGKPVLVFSMEMPSEQIVMRMLASLGRIDMSRVTSGKLEEDDWPRFSSAVSLLAEQKLFIDDSAGLSPTEIRARARRVARDQGEIGLIMIDYMQLMQVPGAENRVNEISEISRSLKGLAKEMECPVIALSQLNRSLEQRPNKRPIMSDLRESGAIEQDADIIMFIYRDEVYNEDSDDKGTAEIIIGKQRNGPIGTVRLAFLGRYTRFEDLAHNNYGEY
ncbi:replicative DNA helicase [Ketobacter sp. MCCC 1A13808]|uniref:replicative DNA helicase n=1 Tax=Ketobacter sp. MCCC 1A13808 TaxID=2602738 RepID=UPI000F224AED|nr:replicative DNA helicase [Ketobacter sp. MCCC 1A13808]MVF11428.1 replicative DNA helicase [Ketobacter sp. MCCC 1A13808]RLP54633.1 MAG: replicative DNA helicase [Ketobacter sp.]